MKGMKKIALVLLFTISILCSMGLYMYMQGGTIVNLWFGEQFLIDEQEGYERDAVISSVASLDNVSVTNAATGFWYTYTDAQGNEHVFYFNPNALNGKRFTQEQINQMLGVMRGSKIGSKNTIKPVAEDDLPDDLQFHNKVYSFGKKGNIFDIRRTLERKLLKVGNLSKEELFELAYVYELQGEYKKRDQINARSCKEFNVRCAESKISIDGVVTDIEGNTLSDVDIEALGKTGAARTKTNENGEYTLELFVNSLEKIRIKALKHNYSDGIASVLVVTDKKKEYIADDIVLGTPLTSITINQKNKSITGVRNNVTETGYILDTGNSLYLIPFNAIKYADGRLYTGEVEVVVYEFTEDTVPESLTTVDTFDGTLGFSGDGMKTFGMPYIQFFSPEGEELHVFNDNPMVLRYTLVHMKELRENPYQDMKILSEEDMVFLVTASIAKKEYPIDMQFLTKNNLTNFPAFWVFDRGRGVWDNVGMKVVDTDGTIETVFYTRKK